MGIMGWKGGPGVLERVGLSRKKTRKNALGGREIVQFQAGPLPKVYNKGWTALRSFRFTAIEATIDIYWSIPDNLLGLLDNTEHLFELVSEYMGHAYLVTVLCYSNGPWPTYRWNMEWNQETPIKM